MIPTQRGHHHSAQPPGQTLCVYAICLPALINLTRKAAELCQPHAGPLAELWCATHGGNAALQQYFTAHANSDYLIASAPGIPASSGGAVRADEPLGTNPEIRVSHEIIGFGSGHFGFHIGVSR